jgi:hypothetical protein
MEKGRRERTPTRRYDRQLRRQAATQLGPELVVLRAVEGFAPYGPVERWPGHCALARDLTACCVRPSGVAAKRDRPHGVVCGFAVAGWAAWKQQGRKYGQHPNLNSPPPRQGLTLTEMWRPAPSRRPSAPLPWWTRRPSRSGWRIPAGNRAAADGQHWPRGMFTGTSLPDPVRRPPGVAGLLFQHTQ